MTTMYFLCFLSLSSLNIFFTLLLKFITRRSVSSEHKKCANLDLKEKIEEKFIMITIIMMIKKNIKKIKIGNIV